MPSKRLRDACGLTRREAMRLFGSASALSLIPPALAHYPVGNPPLDASWQPRFLAPADVETVACLSECILSSAQTAVARDPSVHRYIDFALSEAEPSFQASFEEGLVWLENYVTRARGVNFTSLDRSEQYQLLAEISDTSRSHEPKGYAFLTQIKQLTIEGYYRPEGGIFS